jgi:hypothetical protein
MVASGEVNGQRFHSIEVAFPNLDSCIRGA